MHNNIKITILVIIIIIIQDICIQPRPQGFSLKKWVWSQIYQQIYISSMCFTRYSHNYKIKIEKVRLPELVFESNIKKYVWLKNVKNFELYPFSNGEPRILYLRILSVPLPHTPNQSPPPQKEPTFFYLIELIPNFTVYSQAFGHIDCQLWRMINYFSVSQSFTSVPVPAICHSLTVAKLNFYRPRITSAHSAIVPMFLCDVKCFNSFYVATSAVTSG